MTQIAKTNKVESIICNELLETSPGVIVINKRIKGHIDLSTLPVTGFVLSAILVLCLTPTLRDALNPLGIISMAGGALIMSVFIALPFFNREFIPNSASLREHLLSNWKELYLKFYAPKRKRVDGEILRLAEKELHLSKGFVFNKDADQNIWASRKVNRAYGIPSKRNIMDYGALPTHILIESMFSYGGRFYSQHKYVETPLESWDNMFTSASKLRELGELQNV